jgi:hypothetical protein
VRVVILLDCAATKRNEPTGILRSTLEIRPAPEGTVCDWWLWNANMAAHRKLPTLIGCLQPDVLVLRECADASTMATKYQGDVP